MGRKASRELAMKLLYQLEFQKDDMANQLKLLFAENELTENDRSYIQDVIEGVNQHLEQLDVLIETHAKGWKLSRISKVDVSILRLSIYEMLYRKDIPQNVSINEAVELSKQYSGEESGAFVNGILGGVSKSKST
jgi:transcription antitermination protein NusB